MHDCQYLFMHSSVWRTATVGPNRLDVDNGGNGGCSHWGRYKQGRGLSRPQTFRAASTGKERGGSEGEGTASGWGWGDTQSGSPDISGSTMIQTRMPCVTAVSVREALTRLWASHWTSVCMHPCSVSQSRTSHCRLQWVEIFFFRFQTEAANVGRHTNCWERVTVVDGYPERKENFKGSKAATSFLTGGTRARK